MDINFVINLIYIVSAISFALGIKMLGSPVSARRGNLISSAGMLLAVSVTLLNQNIITYQWIIIGVILGAAAGIFTAYRAAMTQMPETIALLHGFGGLASVFVDWSAYHNHPTSELLIIIPLYLSIAIGGITFCGSCVAWGKLSDRLSGQAITFPGMKYVNIGLTLTLIILGILFINNPVSYPLFLIIFGLSLLLGVLFVIPIGGADMPVVISVLNSYAGLVACTTGFVIHNIVLIVVGALVGANGVVLSIIMCKAMNRSLTNVLFGGFVVAGKKNKTVETKEVHAISIPDAIIILETAKSVVIIPGYGLAVAQAQHVLKELCEDLENNGCEVRFAIHPVAGRMPGHMNVLLAEADIPYDQLVEMDQINPSMNTVDVAIVIGANDVVNPAARHDKSSPVYGMPIINADQARTVFVLKRSMATGYAGIENGLFYYENTRMLFGDAKKTLQAMAAEFTEGSAI